jgi:hypothetical protein
MDTTSSTAPIAITCSLRRCINWFSKASAACWTKENRGNGRDQVGEVRVGANAPGLLPTPPDIDIELLDCLKQSSVSAEKRGSHPGI